MGREYGNRATAKHKATRAYKETKLHQAKRTNRETKLQQAMRANKQKRFQKEARACRKIKKHRAIGVNSSEKTKINLKFNFRIILIFLIPVIIAGLTFSQYAKKTEDNLEYVAGNFYFESDVLSDNVDVNTYTYQNGIDKISIMLKNNADELRYSEVKVNYIAKITDTSGNEVIDKNGNKIEQISGTLGNTSIQSNKVEFVNLPNGNYIVIAKSISPYERTLKANFIITNNNEEITYKVSDAVNSPVLQMTILTKDYNGNIKITWPEGVVPDNTNKDFEDVNANYTASSKIINYKANSEYTIQFFKNDLTRKYTDSDFSVERSN